MSENATLSALDSYLQENRDRFVEDLKAVLRIPSVSAQPEHKADVQRCAEHIVAHLKRIGMTRAEVVKTRRAPGRVRRVARRARQADRADLRPLRRAAARAARAVEDAAVRADRCATASCSRAARCDDKGQVYMHLKAIEAHLKVNGKLPINVKMVIEGEEEVGSESLDGYLREQPHSSSTPT